jgi:multicomponent Na+:H+ antiporter subunit G
VSVLGSSFVLIGSMLALIAAVGLVRLPTTYARFHAAGKASPVAFLVLSIGVAVETGWSGAARLAVAGAALVLTLPVGVHLLFRAVHRTTPGDHLVLDELAPEERRARRAGPSDDLSEPRQPPGE